MNSQQAKNEANSAANAQQYCRLLNNEHTRLVVESDRVELQSEQNISQKAFIEIKRKRLALEEAIMSQQVDTELSKRVGIHFGPYDDHVLFLIRGRHTDSGVSHGGYRCA